MPKKATENNKAKKEKTAKEIKPKKLTEAEFESQVLALAKEGFTAEKIGEQLRKQGTHSKEYSKKISKILKEKNQYTNPDLKNIEAKLERVKKHYLENKQDKRAKREKDRIFSQLRQLKKYSGIETR